VINLPKQEDESAFKVELIIGKTVKIDAKNRYFYKGTLETENIPGWGFERYILRKLGPLVGTLIAVDSDAPKVERFIRLGGNTDILRYNSLLPLVVYVPTGVEVSYRVWQAEPVAHFVQKLALPSGQTAVVAEGDFEARSIGSYSIRLYSKQPTQADKGVTFFSSGLIRPRDGTIEKIFLAVLRDGVPPSLIVTIRSVGSGAYLSADAFSIEENNVVHITTVSGMPPGADPIVALKASMQVR